MGCKCRNIMCHSFCSQNEQDCWKDTMLIKAGIKKITLNLNSQVIEQRKNYKYFFLLRNNLSQHNFVC